MTTRTWKRITPLKCCGCRPKAPGPLWCGCKCHEPEVWEVAVMDYYQNTITIYPIPAKWGKGGIKGTEEIEDFIEKKGHSVSNSYYMTAPKILVVRA